MVRKRFVAILFFLTCFLWPPASSFWFFSCRHGNGNGDVGDSCSVFCRCRTPNTCEAGVQRCVSPGQLNDPCHMTRPCGKRLSCHPGVQRCYHVPRRLHEPCVVGFGCGHGLSCHPGIQVCYHALRQFNEPCVAGFPCGTGLSCQPGLQRCLHLPRREGERCSLGFECDAGLECRMCGNPYLTCQMNRVPNMDEEFYHRPYNKVAFLVTHNSFSNSVKYALWVRNQRVSVTQQLKDGVRGLMLDIYPGWGNAEVRLCHGNCFWGGSSNLVDTLIEVRTFLEENSREVITIIFEDYVRNPTILRRVFDQARLSNHVLRNRHWGSRYKDWPTLMDMRRLGRLVVFNNVGLGAFPYTTYNMWYDVRENRYGGLGLDTKTCKDRGESTYNADYMYTNWSLVLINWFGTLSNPLNPCLNSFTKLKEKLITCQKGFGQLANFLAVDFYHDGEKGGAFRAVEWLNERWKDQYKVKTWTFDIMNALKASQAYRDRMTNMIGSNHTNLTVTNSAVSNASTEKRVTPVHYVTNFSDDQVVNKTKHWTNVTHHVTTTNYDKTDHVINGTNKLVNMTYINGRDHVTNHQTNVKNHVTNKTGHVENKTYFDGTIMSEHVKNLTNHVLNLTDHVTNTTNHVTGYNRNTSYSDNTLNYNFTSNYSGSYTNSTLGKNITFKDSTTNNSGMALSSVLANDTTNVTHLDQWVQSKNTSSQSGVNVRQYTVDKDTKTRSSLPLALGNFSLESNGTDLQRDEDILGNKHTDINLEKTLNDEELQYNAEGDQRNYISNQTTSVWDSPAISNKTTFTDVSNVSSSHDKSVELRRGFQSLEEYIDEI